MDDTLIIRSGAHAQPISFFSILSPNIVRVIKSRRMRWAGHVARMGEETVCIGSWCK